jgi:molybdate transport system regulatory protein
MSREALPDPEPKRYHRLSRPKKDRFVGRSNVRLSIRVDLPKGRFGPGKAALLRAIGEAGSISAAARTLGMSYARAWSLTEEMNGLFGKALVDTWSGGDRRGGAALTDSGAKVLRLYDAISENAQRGTARKLAAMASIGKRRGKSK